MTIETWFYDESELTEARYHTRKSSHSYTLLHFLHHVPPSCLIVQTDASYDSRNVFSMTIRFPAFRIVLPVDGHYWSIEKFPIHHHYSPQHTP